MIKYIFPVTAVITVLALVVLIFCLPTPNADGANTSRDTKVNNAYV